jgi:hypothetical protein
MREKREEKKGSEHEQEKKKKIQIKKDVKHKLHPHVHNRPGRKREEGDLRT